MMWGYQGTEQRCIRILAPGSTIDRTLMTVDLWRNIILKLVRSLLCLESIKWKMTRNYGENIYRMSQKKYLVKKSIWQVWTTWIIVQNGPNGPKYPNCPKWSYRFQACIFFWDTLYIRTSNRAWTSLWQWQHSLRLGCQHQCQEGTSLVDVKE